GGQTKQAPGRQADERAPPPPPHTTPPTAPTVTRCQSCVPSRISNDTSETSVAATMTKAATIRIGMPPRPNKLFSHLRSSNVPGSALLSSTLLTSLGSRRFSSSGLRLLFFRPLPPDFALPVWFFVDWTKVP